MHRSALDSDDVSSKGQKGQKGRKAKAGETGVMGSLPSTRPARIGGRRETGPVSKPATPPTVARKPARAKATSVAPKPPRAQAGGPRPVRAAAPELDDAAPPSSARTAAVPTGAQSGTQLVTTVVQAAGKLAQVGLTVGGQVIKRAVGRLPRP